MNDTKPLEICQLYGLVKIQQYSVLQVCNCLSDVRYADDVCTWSLTAS